MEDDSQWLEEPRTRNGSAGGGRNDQYTPDDTNNDSDDGGERALLGSEHKSFILETTQPEESTRRYVHGILLETVPTIVLTTVGLTLTGELLERVSNWQAIKRVNELYILIPMLGSLKGILEMNLSSRLSTSANMGELEDRLTRRQLMLGNMGLLQVQALLASAIAAVLSFLLGLIVSPANSTSEPSSLARPSRRLMHKRLASPGKHLFKRDTAKSGLREFGVVLSTSMASASISGLVLGSFICVLILICRRWRRNPDNITPPIASCLGDLLTLCVVGLVSSVVVRTIDSALPSIMMVLLSLGTVFAVTFTLRNAFVRPLIFVGWTPLLGSMIISCGSGIVLDRFVDRYEGFGLLSIIIGGLPGAVGSILISRVSTSLHTSTSKAIHHRDEGGNNQRTVLTIITLFLVTLPVQGIFLAFTNAIGWTTLSIAFFVIFLVIFCSTVIISLVVSQWLTEYLWRRNLDPDVYAMAIQSSVVDLLAQLMLVLCFEIAQALGVHVKHIP